MKINTRPGKKILAEALHVVDSIIARQASTAAAAPMSKVVRVKVEGEETLKNVKFLMKEYDKSLLDVLKRLKGWTSCRWML